MTFRSLCSNIISTCGERDKMDKLDKKILGMLLLELNLQQKFNEDKTNVLIRAHQQLTQIQNRKATWSEDVVNSVILSIPAGFDNENHWLSEERRLKIKEMLRVFAEKIIEIESQKPKSYRTKRIKKRIDFASELLLKLQ